VRSELGIWAVRMEAEKLGEVLAERLGGELIRPWLGAEVQQEGPGGTDSRKAEPQEAESRRVESQVAGWQKAESRQTESQKVRFREQFGQRSHWVLVMATGIATRFVDGLLRDKHQDPAVVVLDEAGRYAVALVGGHEGGANALAYRVANAVGAIPVVTTATEAMKSLVVGIGCRRGVSEQQIERAVLHALAQRGGVGPGAGAGPDGGEGGDAGLAEVRELATVDLKANEPGLLSFSQRHGIPLRVIARHQIEGRSWVSQPSEWVRQSVGLDGVCEPCALIASTRGRLVVPKTALDGVAVAIVADEWGLVS
jgi:cobalt-precorrin 5A hydrolase